MVVGWGVGVVVVGKSLLQRDVFRLCALIG